MVLGENGWKPGTKLSTKMEYASRHGSIRNQGLLDSWIPQVKELEKLQKEQEDWKQERDQLLEVTALLDEHPGGYDGPCGCKLCQSYSG